LSGLDKIEKPESKIDAKYLGGCSSIPEKKGNAVIAIYGHKLEVKVKKFSLEIPYSKITAIRNENMVIRFRSKVAIILCILFFIPAVIIPIFWKRTKIVNGTIIDYNDDTMNQSLRLYFDKGSERQQHVIYQKVAVIKTLNQNHSSTHIGNGDTEQKVIDQPVSDEVKQVENITQQINQLSCPKCGNKENPAGSKFCNSCGSGLNPICPNCAQSNPAGASFCGHCGSKLN
jgi:Double zinc ribbon